MIGVHVSYPRARFHTIFLAIDRIAGASTVLLQNNGALPIKQGVKKIAVLGDAASTAPIVSGGGSGHVQPPYIITVLDGVASKAAEIGASVEYCGTQDVDYAKQLASDSDIVIVATATTSGMCRVLCDVMLQRV